MKKVGIGWLLVAGIVILLLAGCEAGAAGVLQAEEGQPAGAARAGEALPAGAASGAQAADGPASGAQVGAAAAPASQVTVEPDDAGSVVAVQEAEMAGPQQSDADQSSAPGEAPSLEERDAMLDRVNLGGPTREDGSVAPPAGPMAGTESGTAGEDVKDVPGGVNLGGPTPAPEGAAPVEGPAQAAASERAGDAAATWMERATSTLGQYLGEIAETLRSWWSGLRN